MDHKKHFLAGFDPVPEGIRLPDRILLAYEPVSCLTHRKERSVWKLRRRADGTPFVLKVVPAGEEDLAEEFHILNQLSPVLPGSVPYPIDYFRHGDTDYLLRSFLPGETLTQYRDRVGSCSPQVCVGIGRKLCALLETLQAQEPPVVHRDIKPENIILLPNGRVGLIDFGIARQHKDGQDTDTRHLGTRTTAAPEQYGYAQTDSRTDLYALGMTLIWLMTGQYDQTALRRTRCLPRWLARVLEQGSSFDPEARYASAAAFDAALRGPWAAVRKRLPWIAAGLCAGIFLWTFFLGGAGANPNDPVEFSSECLEQAVRSELERPEGTVTYRDLEQVERLALVGKETFSAEQTFVYRVACIVDGELFRDAPEGDVSDLSLLAHMPNLTELHLNRQNLSDLTPLSELPLTTLTLCENEITDISPLQEIKTLETLYLGGNPIEDHSALAALTNLKDLNIDSSRDGISTTRSLDFLSALDLRRLSISMLEPLDGNWEPLKTQSRLEYLHLWAPTASAFEAAEDLPHLRSLHVGNWPGGDLTPIANCRSLEVIGVYDGLERLDGVSSLTGLLTLAVGNGPITDLSPLAGMYELNYLQLENLPVGDFSPLMELPSLQYVEVDQDQLPAVESACPGYAFQLAAHP